MGDVTAEIAVDPDSSVPPFEQVRTQIADLIGAGRMLPGDRLPTVPGPGRRPRASRATRWRGPTRRSRPVASSRRTAEPAPEWPTGQHTAEVALATLAALVRGRRARRGSQRGSCRRPRAGRSASSVQPIRLSPSAVRRRGVCHLAAQACRAGGCAGAVGVVRPPSGTGRWSGWSSRVRQAPRERAPVEPLAPGGAVAQRCSARRRPGVRPAEGSCSCPSPCRASSG